MDWLHVFILAVIQGLTEFLPVSSSAHLLFPHLLLGWPDQGLAFDVAVHVGSLAAVIWYFRVEIVQLLRGFAASLAGKRSADGDLAWIVGLATIPAGLAGLLLDGWVEANLRTILVVGLTTLGFGLLLGWADRNGGGSAKRVSWRVGLLIGLAQVLAIIPGTSRSGITMTAALMLGLDRETSARFSFLLSIPLIAAAGSYKTLQLMSQAENVDWMVLALGVIFSALAAYACIHVFLRLLARVGFMPFVVYRVVLGGILLAWYFLAL